jgi:hypothetical protein
MPSPPLDLPFKKPEPTIAPLPMDCQPGAENGQAKGAAVTFFHQNTEKTNVSQKTTRKRLTPHQARLCHLKKSTTAHIFCVEYAPTRERRVKRAFPKTRLPTAGLFGESGLRNPPLPFIWGLSVLSLVSHGTVPVMLRTIV